MAERMAPQVPDNAQARRRSGHTQRPSEARGASVLATIPCVSLPCASALKPTNTTEKRSSNSCQRETKNQDCLSSVSWYVQSREIVLRTPFERSCGRNAAARAAPNWCLAATNDAHKMAES